MSEDGGDVDQLQQPRDRLQDLGDPDLQDHLKEDVIKEALASGLDLREYSKKVT
jgi:hypothetical protein